MEDNEKMDEKRLMRERKRQTTIECCQTYWLNRFPVLIWIKEYNWDYLINDLIAGITVGLTAIPQGVAYAVVAGLSPQFGLYSGYMACFVYLFLGTVKDMTIGPTAIMALMVHPYVEKYNSDFAVLACFLSGCVTLVFGMLHLGFLVNFISLPVTVGFTTAAALTIATSQLKSLLGIPGKSQEFIPTLISTLQDIAKTRFEDLTLGLATIAFLIGTKKFNERMAQKHKNTVDKRTRLLVLSLRFFSLGRNGIAVVVGTLTAFLFSLGGLCPFKLTAKVGPGHPHVLLPPFSTHARINNETVYLPFESMVRIMSTSVISIPVISILETIAIGKIFSRGNSLNATQEMIALGVSNILGSFVQSMPTAGSFTRSVINNASGVKTPLGGLFTGSMILAALALTSTFEYIPKASLAGVILTAMFYMVDYHEFILIWRSNRLDMVPLCVTIVACLGAGLDLGILLGVIVNFLLILYMNIKPKIIKQELTVQGKEVIVFQIRQTPFYVGAEYAGNFILKSLRLKKNAFVVIDGTNMLKTDSTTIKTFNMLAENLEKFGHQYVFWNWSPEYKELYVKVNEDLVPHFQNTATIEQLLPPTTMTSSENTNG